MGSNSFGTLFKITTWGESHGKAIGVVIDGCPAGLPLSEEDIALELVRRKPGNSPYTSPRAEQDIPHLLSGVFEGKTTGTPISLIIYNHDADSSAYNPHLLRPGHAQFTYLEKYGICDGRGGGRASARETACRVAAGAIAKKILHYYDITLMAYIKEVGGIVTSLSTQNPPFCADPIILQKIEEAKAAGDSLGGIVECLTSPLPVGLGDPVYEKLEANLAKAMLSLPASKGVEFGEGFAAARMQGSEHNDLFALNPEGQVITTTNHAGGTLGGISTGMPLLLRVAFKPPSSIRKSQETLDINKEPQTLTLPPHARHDPCVALRAVPVVEAMTALVLVDALLLQRCTRLKYTENP